MKRIRQLTLIMIYLWCCASLAGTADRGMLIKGSFKDKADFIDVFAAQSHEAVDDFLMALVEGKVFYSKADYRLSLIYRVNDGYRQFPLDAEYAKGSEVLLTDKSGYKKIRLNNRLRRQIKNRLAERKLNSPDAGIRREAVKQFLKSAQPQVFAEINNRLLLEEIPDIREQLQWVKAMIELPDQTGEAARASIGFLGNSLEPAALNSLRMYIEQYPDHPEALSAIRSIENKQRFFALIENLFFGLSFGSVLVLAAIGLAITFGVMGVINMAHGELIMIGAYTTFVIQQLMPSRIEMSILVAIPAAFVVSGGVGILMERLVIQYLKGRPLETLLATFGISLLLQQAVRTVFSPLNKTVVTPEWLSGSLVVNPVLGLAVNRLAIVCFTLLLFFALWYWMKKSRQGLQVRAVTQNRYMAEALGVNAARVDMLTFGLGAGIAGVAGVALGLLSNVGPNMGQGFIIDSFIVVVFGGVGNLFGTLVAGLSLGIANKWLEPMAGAVLAKILLLVFIVLFIQKRPQGLFPARGRAQEVSQ